jgi:hypothetical protein
VPLPSNDALQCLTFSSLSCMYAYIRQNVLCFVDRHISSLPAFFSSFHRENIHSAALRRVYLLSRAFKRFTLQCTLHFFAFRPYRIGHFWGLVMEFLLTRQSFRHIFIKRLTWVNPLARVVSAFSLLFLFFVATASNPV